MDSQSTATMTELSAVATGTMIRLDNQSVVLERVERLGVIRDALSPVRGVELTRIRFRRNGRTERLIYPSLLRVERLRRRRSAV